MRTAAAMVAAALLLAGGPLAAVGQGPPAPKKAPGAPASYTQHHWTTAEGLPVSGVSDVAQGPQGYLWLGTYDGLVRFDGTTFEPETPVNATLPSSDVRSVQRGPDGNLWVNTTRDYVVRVDPQRPSDAQVYGRGRGDIAEPVVTADVGPKGTMWLGTREDLYRQSPTDTTWQAVLPDSAHVGAIAAGPDGTAWAGTRRHGLWRAQGDRAYQVARRAPDGQPLRNLRALSAGPNGVWVGGENGAFRVEDGRLVPVGGQTNPLGPVIRLDVTADGTLWALNGNGAFFEVANGQVRRVGQGRGSGAHRGVRTGPDGHRWTALGRRILRDGRPVLTASRRINCLFRDREGNWWVGTDGDGLYRLRRTPITMIDSTDGLPSENVYGLTLGQPDSQAVYVGSIGGGPARIDGDPFRDPEVRPLRDAWDLPPTVWTAVGDRDGRGVWLGTQKGLYRRRAGTTRQAPIPNGRVQAVYEDRSGDTWTLVQGGLYRHDGTTWHSEAEGIGENRLATSFTNTRNGSLWISTSKGLLRYREQAGRVDTLTPADGLPSEFALSVHEDEEGLLWVGTAEGLVRIDRRGTLGFGDDQISRFDQEEGLPDDLAVGLRPDDDGRLWMSSHQGLYRVERAALNAVARGEKDRVHPVVYTEDDGLGSREANGGAHRPGVRTPDGRLWFPTQAGVAVVDPEATIERPPPPAAIEAVAPADTTVADTTYRVAPGDTLRLQPEQRTFTVRYAGLHFANPEATRFKVRLANFDRQPTRTEQRRVRYTEVEPGRYTLNVRAAGERGVFGDPATLRLVVKPFWWETWWFYMLCGLGLVGLGIGGYRWRTWQLRKRQEALEETVAERTEEVRRQRDRLEEQAERLQELDDAKSRLFANVSHEFRTPLTLIEGPVREVRRHLERGRLEAVPATAEEDAEQLAIVERNTARLRRLVDQLLGLARLEAGTYDLAARPTDLWAEADRIVRTFEPLAEQEGIALAAQAPTEDDMQSPDREPVYVDREALERILSNLLSNALKFTPEGGRVTVTVRPWPNAAEVAVADTGPGIPRGEREAIFSRFERADDTASRETDGLGIGLALTQDLVELHGGTIELDSVEGEGSTFTIRLPRGRSHLAPDQLAERAPERAEEEPPPDAEQEPVVLSEAESSAGKNDRAYPPGEAPPSKGDEATDEERRRVLVVDDNADVRRYVRRVLTPRYEVVEAADGEEGRAVAQAERPDVILADVMMPAVDGREMTRRLRQEPETTAIPVIMVTARASTEDEVEGLQEGADDYVTKPFDADVLQARIDGQLSLQERLRRRLRAERTADETGPEGEEKDAGTDDRSAFERRARAVIAQHLPEPDFGVSELAETLGVSRSTLYRRLKSEAGCTPSALLRRARTEEGAALLEDGEPVTQVAYAVGYDSLSGFTAAFREEYGEVPSTYAPAD